MAQLTLHVALHLHQPAGVPDAHVADAVARCYAPLIDLLEAAPAVHVALHVGGHLLEWLDANDRILSDRLVALVRADRVEIIGGGFYGPVTSLLLFRDAIGQLEMTSGYFERRAGVRPTGAWLSEQVWTPRMAEILSDAGLRWTMIDERALRVAGVEGELSGWYITEHVARPVALFPIDLDVGQRAWTDSPRALIDHLRARLDAHGEDLTLTWAVDAQRLAADHGAGLPWLIELFERAGRERGWLHIAPASQSLSTTPAQGRVYLPERVHPDLVELTLQPARVPAWRARESSEGWQHVGVWQAFFARYGEADRLHKRMIEAARRFAAVERVMRNGGYRAMSRLTRPRRMLYRGQTGDAYGHGHRAGIHDARLRAGVYRDLIAAEVACDELIAEPGCASEDRIEVGLRDLFADMTTNVLLRSRHLRCVVQPSRGGTIVGFEHIGSCSALHDVLTRRAEVYHRHGAQPIDGHERAWMHDRFLTPDAATEAWMDDSAELGDLMAQPYRVRSVDEQGWGGDARVSVELAGEGTITIAGQRVAAAVLKQTRMRADRAQLHATWSVEFGVPLPTALDFGVECNLSSLGVDVDGLTLTPSAAAPRAGVAAPPSTVGATLAYHHNGLQLRLDGEGFHRLDRAPIVTLARPVGGVCRPCFQGISLLLRRQLAAGTRRFVCSLAMQVSA